jgi:hypothetical protein
MKRTFTIKSVKRASLSANTEVLYKYWESFSLECVKICQKSDRCWKVRLKGKKEDIQRFVRKFSTTFSKIFTISDASFLVIDVSCQF